MRQDLVVVGDYGMVGRRIAIDLAQDYPGRIVLGDRNLARANTCANDIGSGVRGIFDHQSIVAALDAVATVISCIDQPGRAVLHASIARGLCQRTSRYGPSRHSAPLRNLVAIGA
jgi:saccharopine dehydrogenase (NAD+, L-lysine-forming)